jgi:hypothetical protein
MVMDCSTVVAIYELVEEPDHRHRRLLRARRKRLTRSCSSAFLFFGRWRVAVFLLPFLATQNPGAST